MKTDGNVSALIMEVYTYTDRSACRHGVVAELHGLELHVKIPLVQTECMQDVWWSCQLCDLFLSLQRKTLEWQWMRRSVAIEILAMP